MDNKFYKTKNIHIVAIYNFIFVTRNYLSNIINKAHGRNYFFLSKLCCFKS